MLRTVAEPRRTSLYDAHRALGARIIEFGGWAMPVQYPTGIVAEHQRVRTACGMFDVSHMGELEVRGPRAGEAVQRVVTGAVARLAPGAALYTVACRPDGGIIDDLIVYRLAVDHFLVVVNASNIDKDHDWFRQSMGALAELVNRSDETALIAVQGPQAPATLAPLWAGPPLEAVRPFQLALGRVAGRPATAARTGYTGEDGFELFVAAADATAVWEALATGGAWPIGLGARDTLRLEARLCLYGNDIDETTTPLEAGLGWVVKLEAGDFIGRAALEKQKAEGVRRRLVGMVMRERGIARHGYAIQSPPGAPVGTITSGAPSPSTGQNIALGYVPTALAEPGQTLHVDCRGKLVRAEVVKGPFYKRGTTA
jgi:aminomethyltransferase